MPQITAVIILSLLVAAYIIFQPSSSDGDNTNSDDFPHDNSETVQYFANRNNLVNVLSGRGVSENWQPVKLCYNTFYMAL